MFLARLNNWQRCTGNLPSAPTRKARAIIAAACIALFAAISNAAFAQAIVVGGKDFTEQLLMAEITTQLLRSKGFDVEKRSGYTTASLRKAQEAGLVDVYWEYTGTSLREFNKASEHLSPAESYQRVKQLDAEKGLLWLEPSGVNNTYALAMRQDDARARGIATISDLAAQVRKGERFVLATNPEFYERSDGLRPLERAYEFEFGGERVVRLDTDLIYQVLRDLKLVDVGLVFATDGRVASYDFITLRDDKEFFPEYAMAPVIRKQTLDRYPQLATHLEQLSAILDNEAMAKLNAMVDIDRIRIAEVASAFLRRSGLH